MSGYVHKFKLGKVQPLIQKYRYLKRTRPEQYGGSYFKNACAEIPELLFFSLYGIAGFAVLGWALWKDSTSDYFRNKPYKRHYLVLRSDDPRVQKINPKFYDRCEGVYEKAKYRGQE